jgi:acetophenone carboxylase
MMYHNPVNFMSVSTNTKVHNSAGIYGGYSPNTIPGIVIKNGDLREKLSNEEDVPYDVFESLDEWIEDPETDVEISHHCRRTQQYDVGDMFIGYSSGGAGYGDAVERDPKAVMKDLEDNRITHWSAKNIYKVEYDEEALIVDEEGTEELREEFLEERRDESVPFDEFIDDWETRKPKDEILTAYGSWPNAEKDRRIIRQ